MNFALDEIQQQVLDLAEKVFADATTQQRLRTLDHQGYFDRDLWKTLASTGLLGLASDNTAEGNGLGFDTLAVLLEQSGRFVAPVPLVPVLVTAALTLQRNAADVAARLLPPLIAGDHIITAALAEPGNDDPHKPGMSARKDGDEWMLTGTKTAVPALTCRPAALWLTAMTPEGLGVFLLEDLGAGTTISQQTLTTGEYVGQLQLMNARGQLLAIGPAATHFVNDALMLTQAAWAAVAVGACAAMTRMAAEYTGERIVFGRAVATFQAVSHRVADCHIDSECLRSVALQAISDISSGSSAAARSALVAKIWACEALHRVSHSVQQVHGGLGIDRDYPLFRYALLAKSIELSAGGAEPLLEELGLAIATD